MENCEGAEIAVHQRGSDWHGLQIDLRILGLLLQLEFPVVFLLVGMRRGLVVLEAGFGSERFALQQSRALIVTSTMIDHRKCLGAILAEQRFSELHGRVESWLTVLVEQVLTMEHQ